MTEEREDHQAPVQEKVDEAESDLSDLERRAEELGEQIDDTRGDWEDKKADPSVPGAVDDPSRANEAAGEDDSSS